MEIQTSDFPADAIYFLDSALEHEEIDASTRIALQLYGDRKEVTAIIDEEWTLGPGTIKRNRLAKCAQLAAIADSIFSDLPTERRGAIGLAGLMHARGVVIGNAQVYAQWGYEDSILGGCEQPFKRAGCRSEWRRMDNYELSPKQRRRLYGPNWIRFRVKKHWDTPRLRRYGATLINRLADVPTDVPAIRRAARALDADLQIQREQVRRRSDAAIRAVAGSWRNRITDRREKNRARKVIARAAMTAATVVGSKAVSDFAAGRLVVLPGQTLSLEVSRWLSCATIGHSGLTITAISPAGRRLADMCVYHEGTPALDQLTALALGMAAGEEAEIVQTANLSRVTAEGFAHPLIGARATEKDREAAWRPRDRRQEVNEAYWQETKGVWTSALGVAVVGRLWPILNRIDA